VPVQMVDAVVLSWNRITDTIESLDSLLHQQRVITNITLVDQGSDLEPLSDLRKYAARFAEVHLIELGENLGVAAGRNKGIRAGSAEIIISIDNDAVFTSPTNLHEVTKRFEEDPKLGALGFRVERGDSGKLDPGSWVYPKSLLPRQHERFLATRFCGAGHAIRRSAYEKTAGYDERLFFFWEELDLSYQLIQQGYSIGYDPSIVVKHKMAQEGRTHWRGNRFYFLVRNALFLDWKYFGSPLRLSAMATGYLIKSLYNRVTAQGLRGARDAYGMIRAAGPEGQTPIDSKAIAYIRENDLKYRGSLVTRIVREVVAPLPGS